MHGCRGVLAGAVGGLAAGRGPVGQHGEPGEQARCAVLSFAKVLRWLEDRFCGERTSYGWRSELWRGAVGA